MSSPVILPVSSLTIPMKALRLLLLFVIVCSVTTTVVRSQERASNSSSNGGTAASALSVNDRVQVRVFQEEDLNGEYRIAQDGTINFPLVGSIKISGKSSDDASRTLSDALKRYLKHPQVNIAVIEFAKRRFTIMGQVQKPGTYLLPVEEKLDLLSAIAAAGGFTRMADQNDITIKRQKNGGESSEKVSAKAMTKPGAPGYAVQVGDQIWVGERAF